MTVTSPGTAMPAGPSRSTPLPDDVALALRYDALLSTLADRVTAAAVGRHIPTNVRLADSPQSRLWLGMLTSEPQLIADQKSGFGYRSKIVPAAQGFSFRVGQLPATVEIAVSAVAYLALHPTVDEQRAAVNDFVTMKTKTNPDHREGQGYPGQQGANQQGHKLAQVWAKCPIEPVSLTVEIPVGQSGSWRVGGDKLAAALTAATKPPAGSSLLRQRRPSGPPGSLPRDDDTGGRSHLGTLRRERTARSQPCPAATVLGCCPGRCQSGRGRMGGAADGHQHHARSGQSDNRRHPPVRAGLLRSAAVRGRVDRAHRTKRLSPMSSNRSLSPTVMSAYVPAFGHACAVGVEAHTDRTATLRRCSPPSSTTKRVDARERFTAADGTAWPIDVSFATLTADPVGRGHRARRRAPRLGRAGVVEHRPGPARDRTRLGRGCAEGGRRRRASGARRGRLGRRRA